MDRTGLTGGFEITLTYPEDALAPNVLPAIKPLLEGQTGLAAECGRVLCSGSRRRLTCDTSLPGR